MKVSQAFALAGWFVVSLTIRIALIPSRIFHAAMGGDR